MENPRVWFRSISLENVRSFGSKQTIYFTEDGTENSPVARWNVLLGDNGTGKTTVLKGLVVSVQNQQAVVKTGVDLTEFWRNKGEIGGATVEVMLDDQNNKISSLFKIDYASDGPKNSSYFRFLRNYEIDVAVFAYNAARRISTTGISEDSTDPISNFFGEESKLTNAEEWLIQADYLSYKDSKYKKRYEIIDKVLSKLFEGEVYYIFIELKAGVPKVFFSTVYGDVNLHELSLGYKTTIAWMVDFAKGLLDHYPGSPNPLAEPAVCLVDEIDLHLHPKFQRNIIKFLTDTFPNTQFIVTAHSSLVVQAAEDYQANLIVLKREGNETVVTNGLDVRNWRVDQILSSDLFEGISPRAPEAEAKMARRRHLLVQDSLSSEEKTELAELERELDIVSVSDTWESVKTLDIIRKAMLNQE